MGASIWTPGTTIPSTANADNTLKGQRFTAAAAQTVFTLTLFQYVPATGSLLVFINGVKQFLASDYTETSSSSITLTAPTVAGDLVEITGYIGGTAAVAAQTSAAASAVSAAAALVSKNAADADVVLCDADVVLCDADVVAAAAQVALAAGQAGLAQNYAQLANITDYGAITGATTFTADYGSV